MTAFFGDVDVAALVDAKKIRNGVTRAKLGEVCSVGWAEDVDIDLRNKERSGAENGLEASGDIGVEGSGEFMAVALAACRGAKAEELAIGAISNQEIVDRKPRRSGGGNSLLGRK